MTPNELTMVVTVARLVAYAINHPYRWRR